MLEARTITHTLDLCLRIGDMLMSNGAGAADVSATMDAVARKLGLRNVEIDVTFTSLAMSYQASVDESPHVLMRQVKQRDIDYEDLTRVDHLVAAILWDEVSLSEARSTIARIASSGHHRARWSVTLGWGVMCAGVGLMLGGDIFVVLIAFIAACLIDRLQLALHRRRIPVFYHQVGGGAIATVLAVGCAATGLGIDPSLVVTANIIMLLSGLGFMGAFQDALSGYYITSAARFIEVMLSTAGIIAGVSGGLAFAQVIGVEIGQLQPISTDLRAFTALAVGGAICAAAFAYSAYSPKRALLPIGIIAGVAIVITRIVEEAGFGRTWAVGLAAFGVGLVAFATARMVRVPVLVVVVSGVVPLLPGLSIYRGLTFLGEGGVQVGPGILAIMTAASVAMAIAAGVILGEYVAQPLAREARRLESRLAGPRLVGPLRSLPRKIPGRATDRASGDGNRRRAPWRRS